MSLDSKPFQYVIGLEIHVQLKTLSKMFCRCSNDGENQPPNTTICPVCVGHPGTLPVINEVAVRMGARMARALNCTIHEWSKFDRKNYFYPDLPKGYQISQYDKPVGKDGYLDIRTDSNAEEIHVRINRLHLEEDAAKLLHTPDHTASLVDYNRSSTPLMEIVTEPDMKSPQEAKAFLQELRLLARYLDVSTADMDKGHLRCDANVSIKFEHDKQSIWTPISEIKNLNSFRSVERALEYEAQRVYEEWVAGGEIRSRTSKITVGWDDARATTKLQRSKEEAHDYRYFPEPDIPPLHFTTDDIRSIDASIPELPAAKRLRFKNQYGIPEDDAHILIEDKPLSEYYEEAASKLDAWLCTLSNCDDAFRAKTYKLLAGWLINKLSAALSTRALSREVSGISPENFAELIACIAENKINSSSAQTILDAMVGTTLSPLSIIKDKGLEQVSDTTAIELACHKVINEHADAVANYRAGKTTTIMFLVGQVMKEMQGKAQPDIVKSILEKILAHD